jgi:hypothetical protein
VTLEGWQKRLPESLIINLLTASEEQDLVERYGSMKALSDFRLDFPHDYNPDWLQKLDKRRWTKEEEEQAKFLKGTDLLSNSERKQQGVTDDVDNERDSDDSVHSSDTDSL